MPKPVSPEPKPQPTSQSHTGSTSSTGAKFESAKSIDPTGTWTKFLQQLSPGQPVTPEEVKLFQQGLEKWFGLEIARENRIMKEAMKKLKDSAQGN